MQKPITTATAAAAADRENSSNERWQLAMATQRKGIYLLFHSIFLLYKFICNLVNRPNARTVLIFYCLVAFVF